MSSSFVRLDAPPETTPPAPWRPDALGQVTPPGDAPEPEPGAEVEPSPEAYRRGHADGCERAREELAAQRQDLEAREAALCLARLEVEAQGRGHEERLRDERTAMLRGAQLQLVELAVKVAERLLRAQLRLSPDTVIRVAREALAQVEGGAPVRVRVNPEEADALREAAAGLVTGTGIPEMEVVPQPGLERGELEVETAAGTLDARWSSQLARVARELRRAVAGEEGP